MMQISFVCSGNICRSPMAEMIGRSLLAAAGLGDAVGVESHGVAANVGQSMDPQAAAAVARVGFASGQHRARQFEVGSFSRLDLIVALDRSVADALVRIAPAPAAAAKVHLLLSFDPDLSIVADVPNPWGHDDRAFDEACGLIARGTRSLVAALHGTCRLGNTRAHSRN